MVNHIEALKQITSKTGLVRRLTSYYESCEEAVAQKYTVFDSTPSSFIIEANVEDENYFALLQRFKEMSQQIYFKEHVPDKHCVHNVWIVKPANLNQGEGFV